MKILLRDKDEKYQAVAIIETETSTAEEVQHAIYKVKEIEDYNSEDLEAGLPEDCTISWYDRETDAEVVW